MGDLDGSPDGRSTASCSGSRSREADRVVITSASDWLRVGASTGGLRGISDPLGEGVAGAAGSALHCEVLLLATLLVVEVCGSACVTSEVESLSLSLLLGCRGMSTLVLRGSVTGVGGGVRPTSPGILLVNKVPLLPFEECAPEEDTLDDDEDASSLS